MTNAVQFRVQPSGCRVWSPRPVNSNVGLLVSEPGAVATGLRLNLRYEVSTVRGSGWGKRAT